MGMELKEGMTFKEFSAQKRPRSKGKLNSDFGVKDYYSYYKHTVWRYQGGKTQRGTFRKRMNKNGKWTISPVLYRKILCSINLLLLEATLKGEDIELPVDFGTIYARHIPVYIKLDEEGNVKTNRAINWNGTLKLWYEDKEARQNGQLVLQDNCTKKPYIGLMFGDFTNKKFFHLQPSTTIMRKVAKDMQQGLINLPPKGTRTKAIKDIKL